MRLPPLTLAFLIGMLPALYLPVLPSWYFLAGCFLCIVVFGFFITKNTTILLLMALAGFSWFTWHANDLLKWHLPADWENTPLQASGSITSLPIDKYGKQQFSLQLQTLCLGSQCSANSSIILLNWQEPSQPLMLGQHWKLWVKLKSPRGFANPGSFDRTAWLFQHKIRASGYVITRSENQLLPPIKHSLNKLVQWRQQANQQLSFLLKNQAFSGVITALTLGNSSAIRPTQWQVFRNTGTGHLIAISGLHIGMIAGALYWLVARAWRFFPRLCLYVPAPQMGAIGAMIGAFAYSLLSGFSISAQRALIMIMVWMSASLWCRHVSMLQRFMLALLLVLLMNPYAIMNNGFWLSFTAITVIGYGMGGRLATKSLWWKWGRVQWVVGIGLVPLSWLLFQQNSLMGWFANLVAIPWVGWVTVPLALLGCLLLPLSQSAAMGCFWLANKSLEVLWPYLTWLADLPFNSAYYAFYKEWLVVFAIVAALLILAPIAMPARALAVIWILPLLYIKPASLPLASLRVTTLDVGQGLAIVVETRHHVLLYDTGMGYPDGYNLGDAVIIPFLRANHIQHIDKLMISHGDVDHSGGAAAILKRFPRLAVSTSATAQFHSYPLVSLCQAGQKWVWDEVYFSVLYPLGPPLAKSNDSSCVLQIKTPNGSALLTGDIEHRGEQALVQTYGAELQADVLIAPHHGSKTSSSLSFIQNIHPKIVIFSTGYLNQYHFPHPAISQRYQAMDIEQLNTAYTGAVTITIAPDKPLNIQRYRQQKKHFYM